MCLSGENRYIAQQSNFAKIPVSPVAYWASQAVFHAFSMPSFSAYFFAGHGLLSGHDESMIYFWHEVSYEEIGFDSTSSDDFHRSFYIFAPMAKGGDFRKWYGKVKKQRQENAWEMRFCRCFPFGVENNVLLVEIRIFPQSSAVARMDEENLRND